MRSIVHTSRYFWLIFFTLSCVLQFPEIRALAQLQPPNSNGAFSLDQDRLPIASLNGLWRFHTGDDPAFSDPAFDDSEWELVPADQSEKKIVTLPSGSTSFWYRTRIFVPAGSPPLSLYMPFVPMNYEIFADGQRIGGIGSMPPHTNSTDGVTQTFDLPADRAPVPGRARVISISIRCWQYVLSPSFQANDLGARIRIGATPLIQETALLHTRNIFWYSASDLFLALLNTLACLTAMGLFLYRRQEREYLWYGLVTVIFAIIHIYSIWTISHAHGWPLYLLTVNLLWQASSLALMVFLFRLLGGERNKLFWIGISSIFLNLAFALSDFVPYMFREEWKWADIRLYNGLSFLFFLPFATWIVVFVTRKAIERQADARLLWPAVVLVALGNVLNFGLVAFQFIFNWGGGRWSNWFFNTSDWPIPFSVQNLSEVFLLLTMLAVLIRRFTRTRLHEEAYEREREAARSVQQVMIPEAIPTMPGFLIAAVYKPFGEVGGDFFQVIPIESGRHIGSVVVVIGDVSGKGLPAAMTVSLLVGTIRTLVHYTQSPVEILTAMNQRMIGRSSGGFTTCLALRADPDGTFSIANAGHISPYVNGVELPLENGLPLGLSSDADYAESTLSLPANVQLTLITDGVIEARSKTGELFGFDRTQSVSRESPESIAQTAKHFGQDDDITVLSVRRI